MQRFRLVAEQPQRNQANSEQEIVDALPVKMRTKGRVALKKLFGMGVHLTPDSDIYYSDTGAIGSNIVVLLEL